jgi:PrtD family type I secretion system ABC transporter
MAPLMGFSLIANLLMLVAPLYMLQIYDRVLTSGSADTLIWLTLIAGFLFAIYGAAEAGRRRLAALATERLDQDLSSRIFARFEAGGADIRLADDLTLLGRIRPLLQNQLVFPFLDLPFVPLFLGLLFIVHPVIGTVGLAGAALVMMIAVAAEIATREPSARAAAVGAEAQDFAAGMTRQRSAMVAMGLVRPAYAKWGVLKDRTALLQLDASRRDAGFASASRAVRQGLQMLILAAGAALAIAQQVSPGAIVAGSIVLARALGPIDQIVGSWRSIVQAATAWGQLRERLGGARPDAAFTPLPRPDARLDLDRLAIAAPGRSAPLIRPFSIEIQGGQPTAIVGANGAGKTTLLQTISGAWAPGSGQVLLGGRSIHTWASADRGRYVGYLPQDVELMPGTISENIARLEDAAPDEVFAAAQEAGAHEAILRLPEGYDTKIGSGGVLLSAGQRQQIGLARALFRNPVLLLLDEPTANLDSVATEAVIAALKSAAARGTVVIAATHDNALIGALERTLIIRGGAVMAARSEEFLKSVQQRPTALRVTTGGIV